MACFVLITSDAKLTAIFSQSSSDHRRRLYEILQNPKTYRSSFLIKIEMKFFHNEPINFLGGSEILCQNCWSVNTSRGNSSALKYSYCSSKSCKNVIFHDPSSLLTQTPCWQEFGFSLQILSTKVHFLQGSQVYGHSKKVQMEKWKRKRNTWQEASKDKWSFLLEVWFLQSWMGKSRTVVTTEQIASLQVPTPVRNRNKYFCIGYLATLILSIIQSLPNSWSAIHVFSSQFFAV